MNDEILPDGIAVINNEFKIIVFNEAASRITGYVEDYIIIPLQISRFLLLLPQGKL